VFILVLIAAPVVEVFVFVEVGLAIGWILATVLLVGTSLVGVPLLRVQGRRVSSALRLAVLERRVPGRSALDGALGFLGCILLVVPGFVTGAVGAVLVFPPTRALLRRWISRRYAGRVMRFAATASRFAPRDRPVWPADVESTAVEDDRDQLGA
jgi:UPF0716 protein FxsA